MSDQAAFDALAHTLADAHERFGTTAFKDRRRLIGLLADYVPMAKREIRAIGTAIDEGVPAALGASERHLVGMEMDRLADRLEAATGLRLDIARPVVRAFAFALGLGPLPSVYVGAASVAATPPPITSGWAGMSEPAGLSSGPAPTPTETQRYEAGPPSSPGTITFAGKSFPKNQFYLIAASLVLAVGAIQFLGGGNDRPAPGSTVTPIAVVATTPADQPKDAPQTRPVADPVARVAENNYADETTDFGVPAKTTLESNVGSETPLQIPVGRRITTAALQQLLAADPSVVLIDVLDGQHPVTVKGAIFLPGGGNGGAIDDQTQRRLVQALTQLTNGKQAQPIVFFCYGARCWESYNAVLRAAGAGYTDLYWYRGGLQSWQTARLPMEQTPAPFG